MTAGDERPFRITGDGQLKPLDGALYPELGSKDFPDQLDSNVAPLIRRQRLFCFLNCPTHPAYGVGLPAIKRAVAKADSNAAPATLRAIEDVLREAHPDRLDDDATIIVLAPSGMIGPAD